MIGMKVFEIVSTMIDITQTTRKGRSGRSCVQCKLRGILSRQECHVYFIATTKHWKTWIL